MKTSFCDKIEQFHNHEITRGNITHLWALAVCVITSSASVTRTPRLKVLVINILNISPEEEGVFLNFFFLGGSHLTHHFMISEFSSIFLALRVLHFEFHIPAVSENTTIMKMSVIRP